MKATALARELGTARFDCLQPQYSLVCRSIEREHIPLCLEEGIGVIPWSPLGGGLLTGKFRKGGAAPAGSRARGRPDEPRALRERANLAIAERWSASAQGARQDREPGRARLGCDAARCHLADLRRAHARAARGQPGRGRPGAPRGGAQAARRSVAPRARLPVRLPRASQGDDGGDAARLSSSTSARASRSFGRLATSDRAVASAAGAGRRRAAWWPGRTGCRGCRGSASRAAAGGGSPRAAAHRVQGDRGGVGVERVVGREHCGALELRERGDRACPLRESASPSAYATGALSGARAFALSSARSASSWRPCARYASAEFTSAGMNAGSSASASANSACASSKRARFAKNVPRFTCASGRSARSAARRRSRSTRARTPRPPPG